MPVTVSTTEVVFSLNLDARSSDLAIAAFDPTVQSTYHFNTNIDVYDSLGITHNLQTYFIKTSTNEWSVFAFADGVNTVNPAITTAPFTPNSTINYPVNGAGTSPTFTPTDISVSFAPLDSNGAPTGATDPVRVNFDLNAATQFETDFNSTLTQNGGFINDLTFTNTSANELFTGDIGEDAVVFSNASTQIYNLSGNENTYTVSTLDTGVDSFASIEWLQFSDQRVSIDQLFFDNTYSPTLSASSLNDIIASSTTVNTIYAGNGDDFIVNGRFGQTIDGGDGIDTVNAYNFAINNIASLARSIDNSVIITSDQGATLTLIDVEYLSFANSPSSLTSLVENANANKPSFSVVGPNSTIIAATPTVYTGPVSYLQYELLGNGANNVVTGSASNDFLNLLDGDDAADGGDGDDVIDGGLGSNFLIGGNGNDVFYIDGRGSSNGETTWSTIADYQSGDNVNVWGWVSGTSKIITTDVSNGANGYHGFTLHYDLNNDGLIDTSITFTGLTANQINNPVASSVDGNGFLLFN